MITSNYEKSKKYDKNLVENKIMGPNPLKLVEELLLNHNISDSATVMDLGSGNGLTSVFLVKEYGFKVFPTDLWSDPTENKKFFDEMGLSGDEIIPIKADANDLPFAHEFFNAIICADSYNYFGRDDSFLDEKIIPFIKPGGYVYIAVPGMKKDCHDDLPDELLLSWNEEQLDYIHDMDYWRNIIDKSNKSKVISIKQMEGNEELWKDWINCDNEYAAGDKKAIDAGACKYLNFISIVLQRVK